MNLLTLSFACGLIIVANVTHAASDFTLQNKAAGCNIPLAVTTTVEKRTAQYHIFSEKIKMTARIGELWQANGDVLYQTSNHDVTDLATGEDGRYAVKFTNPGEAVIRVYIRKNGEVYVQDYLFTILQENGSSYAAKKSNDSAASGASWTAGKGMSNSDSVYSESNKDVATFPEQVLQLVNEERAKVGARPLRLNDELVAGAKIRAEEISRHMSHDRPDGSSCFTVLRNRNRSLGENIAAGRATPEAVVDQWMHSPGHRANMLSMDFSELGVGYYYKDNSTYKHYWIQMFRG